MISSLSNLADNLSEEIDRIKCKYGDDDKKNVKFIQLNISTVTFFLKT